MRTAVGLSAVMSALNLGLRCRTKLLVPSAAGISRGAYSLRCEVCDSGSHVGPELLGIQKPVRTVVRERRRAMEVTPTLDDAHALRQLTLADEHLMICLCGVEHDTDARVLQEAVQKIMRIKLQMGNNHQIGLARAQGSRLVVEHEFTRNVDALMAAAPGLLHSTDHDDVVDLDTLLADAARYFGAQREMECQATSSFRLLLVYRHVQQRPQLRANQGEASLTFINDPTCHLDIIYWHEGVPLEAAQNVFDQLCAYDSTNPLAKFYFLEVSGSVERLHQALVLMQSHSAHRLTQNAVEQLLESWFSPTKEIDSVEQQVK